MNSDKIYIFDTTLRDGEQSPGFSMNIDEKLIFADQLEKLGVDIIEAGFPVISDGDFEAVSLIAGKIKKAQVAGLARANKKDIEAAARALEKAANPRIHTFISSSDIHIEHQLKKTRDEILKQAVDAVKFAKTFTDNVEFSAMDATRSDRKYLADMVQAVIESGAKTVNIPDTVGYTVPNEFYNLIRYLFENVKNINEAIVAVHCHNDLGLAVANSLSAIQAGARQVECTINGIGERAGNTAMEELVMAIKTRSDILNVHTDINSRLIMPASKLLVNITGVPVQPNKAIVGDNAFAHESGIHQDGVLKNAMTYEIMRPEDIGISKSKLVLGKHSGRHAVLSRLQELGYELKQEELDSFFARFKCIADRKKDIFDEDLVAIIGEVLHKMDQNWRYNVANVQISTGLFSPPMALVNLKDNEKGDEGFFEVAAGNGGVDAGVNAVKKITGTKAYIKSFNLVAITGGSDALCEVSVIVEEEYKGTVLKVFGNGMSIDISVAGIFSFVDAINKLEYMKKRGAKNISMASEGV
ncbi:MAG: 2-isopropylmalate synthase [Leptospirales bacterium]|nr:2-isopropylmalate synthase [Leptospirales bacterium]